MPESKPIPILPELISEVDYIGWFERVTAAVEADGLAAFLTEHSSKPKYVNPNEEWWQNDNRVKTILLQSISRPISAEVMKMEYDPIHTTAHELLRSIQTAVTKTRTAGMTGLEWTGRWAGLKKADFKSWTDYTRQLEFVFKKLAEVGTPLPELFAIRTLLVEVGKYMPKFADNMRDLYDKRDGASLHGLVLAVNCLDQ